MLRWTFGQRIDSQQIYQTLQGERLLAAHSDTHHGTMEFADRQRLQLVSNCIESQGMQI